MSITILSKIKPYNNGQFPVYDDIDGYGGYQVRGTTTDRDSIPTLNRKAGMLVYVQANSTFYQLSVDLITWTVANLGGGGNALYNFTTTNTNYTLQTADAIITVGTTASSITLTLPASSTAGKSFTIKDAAGLASSHNIVISGNGNNIDANPNFIMTTDYMAITVLFDGTKWLLV